MSNTKTSSSLKTLCRTAIFLALLIAVQFVTRSMGQYVTGSLVNLILIASGLMCGLWGGLAVAVLCPRRCFGLCRFGFAVGAYCRREECPHCPSGYRSGCCRRG